jgi:WD40 repeat protein
MSLHPIYTRPIANEDRVWHISWSADGNYLLSCGESKNISYWRFGLDVLQLLDTFQNTHDKTVRRVLFSPNGNFFSSASFDGTVGIWEKEGESYRLMAQLEGHENEVKCATWDSTGSLLATSSRDKTVWIWELESNNEFDCLSVCAGHSQDVKYVKWLPNSEVLFSCSYDNTIKIWKEEDDDWSSATTLGNHQGTVWELDFNPAANKCVSCSSDNSVRIWEKGDSNTNWRISKHVEDLHTRDIYSVSWSKNNFIATGSGDNSIKIINEEGDVVAHVRNAHNETDVNCVAWNPRDPTILASCGDDGCIKFWKFQ